MLENLSDDQKKMMATVRNEWVSAALGGNTQVEEGPLRRWLEFCYGRINKKLPDYEIVGGPLEAQKRANERNGNKKIKHYPAGIGLGYDSGWTAFYDFFVRIGAVKNKDFCSWMLFKDAGVWDCLLFEEVAYIIRRPSLVVKDERGQLHCANGPSAMFPNGEKYYSWHGTRVPERLIMSADDVTREDLLAERNSEVIRAWGEKIGWTRFFSLIDSVVIDSATDPETGLRYELYDLKKRPSPEFARFLKMESPEINDGTRPFYVEPVPPQSKTAMAARKWKVAIKADGTRPTIDECNTDPHIGFVIEA